MEPETDTDRIELLELLAFILYLLGLPGVNRILTLLWDLSFTATYAMPVPESILLFLLPFRFNVFNTRHPGMFGNEHFVFVFEHFRYNTKPRTNLTGSTNANDKS